MKSKWHLEWSIKKYNNILQYRNEKFNVYKISTCQTLNSLIILLSIMFAINKYNDFLKMFQRVWKTCHFKPVTFYQ